MTDEVRILYVDDEPDFKERTSSSLEAYAERFLMETAEEVQKGFDGFPHSGFDADLPFIIYNGNWSEGVASEAISEGVTHHMQKDIETIQYEGLANRLANSVERYRSERDAEDSLRMLWACGKTEPLVDEYTEVIRG